MQYESVLPDKRIMAVHAVVVWEYERKRGGRWAAYSPAVSQHLERANGKQLTRVLLSDADPNLMHYYVNLLNLVQEYEDTDDVVAVRRRCYLLSSPAGKGAKWEVEVSGNRWQAFDMEVQCIIEDAWAKGELVVDMSLTEIGKAYIIDFNNLTQQRCRINSGRLEVRSVRRTKQAPYPLVKVHIEELEHTSIKPPPTISKPTESKQQQKKNLARTILHNLNIFRNSSKSQQHTQPQQSKKKPLDMDSLDTVSTYLSQGSDSCASVDYFDEIQHTGGSSSSTRERSTSPVISLSPSLLPNGAQHLARHLQAGARWAPRQPCPRCRRPLTSNARQSTASSSSGGSTSVAGVPAVPCPPSTFPTYHSLNTMSSVVAPVCGHPLHLNCLREDISNLLSTGAPAHVQCLVCGRIWGERHGNQPEGRMDWHPVRDGLIQILYHVQSGIQTTAHPRPGYPYYAVGFPRVAYLPDTAYGHRLLQQLQTAWRRRLVFSVERSLTTGQEDILQWNVPHCTEPRHCYDVERLEQCERELEALGCADE